MSQTNTEILQRLFDAFNRQDAATARELWATDGEWTPTFVADGPGEGTAFRGHAGISEFLRIQADTWETVKASPVAIREIGDRALVEVHLRAVGRGEWRSGRSHHWDVFEMRSGRVTRGRVYTSEAEALHALGLPH